MTEVIYHGSYVKLDGIKMSEAYASTLRISFDVRGGLLIRQIHHWAADLFVAALMIHMLRVFFTGAYRKPREVNWLIGIVLFSLGADRGPVRLLAARRPAVRRRPADLRGRPAGHPDRRHLPGVLPVRRAVPRARHRAEDVHHPRAADPGPDPGADHRAPVHHVPPEAHADAGQGEHRAERERPAVLPVLHGQDRRLVLLHLRRAGAAVHLRPDQPDLAVRARTRRWPSRPPPSPTSTWASWRARCASCPPGRSTSSGTRCRSACSYRSRCR